MTRYMYTIIEKYKKSFEQKLFSIKFTTTFIRNIFFYSSQRPKQKRNSNISSTQLDNHRYVDFVLAPEYKDANTLKIPTTNYQN